MPSKIGVYSTGCFFRYIIARFAAGAVPRIPWGARDGPTHRPNASAQRIGPTHRPNASAQRIGPTHRPNASAQRIGPTHRPNASAQRIGPTHRPTHQPSTSAQRIGPTHRPNASAQRIGRPARRVLRGARGKSQRGTTTRRSKRRIAADRRARSPQWPPPAWLTVKAGPRGRTGPGTQTGWARGRFRRRRALPCPRSLFPV